MAENQAFVYVLNSKYSAKFAISAILTNPQQDTKSDNFSHYALNLHEGVKRMAVFFFHVHNPCFSMAPILLNEYYKVDLMRSQETKCRPDECSLKKSLPYACFQHGKGMAW